jgi:hypothetical protein
MIEDALSRTEDELREFIDAERNRLLRFLKDEKEVSWSPKLVANVIDYETGQEEQWIAAIVGDFSTSEEKQGAMFSMGVAMYEAKRLPVLVCLITEAWCTHKLSYGGGTGKMPSNDPDRDEVIVFFGCTFGMKHQLLGLISVDRHPDGYLMPGPKSDLGQGESSLMEALWTGMATAARRGKAQNNN